jgi:hypothetical protein
MERIAKDYSPLELSAKRFAFHCPGHPDSMSRARLGWLFGIALVLAGFVPVLVFTLGSLLPGAEASALLGVFPDLSWLSGIESWLHKRKVRWAPSPGLLFALPGLVAMLLGAAIARSQRPALDAVKARKQDARRRRQQYGPSERIEPTLRRDPTFGAVD